MRVVGKVSLREWCLGGRIKGIPKAKWAEGRGRRVIGCANYHNRSSDMINISAYQITPES